MIRVLLNARVFAPEELGIRHLVIAGERIAWLGEDEPALPGQLDAEVADMEGRMVIPGLIDGHAHLTGGGGESGFSSRVPPLAPSQFIRAGVTTAVGVLGTDDTTRDTASLAAQAKALNEEGMSAFCHTGGYHLPPVTLTGSIRRDIVFVDPIIGIGEVAISDHRSSQPTLDELLRIASEAHVAGLTSGKAGIVHLHLGDGPRGLDLVRQALDQSELPPRVFNPTHVNRRKALFEEAMDLAARGVSIDVTAFPVDENEDAWSATEAIARYLSRGLPPGRITVSSDGGGCLPVFDEQGEMLRWGVGSPGALATTLRELLQRDLPAERVIACFGANVADLLRLPSKGRIQVGADADLVSLDEDLDIRDVMARGRWHVRAGGLLVRGKFEGDQP